MKGAKRRKINSVQLREWRRCRQCPVPAYFVCAVTFHTTWQRIPDTNLSIQE